MTAAEIAGELGGRQSGDGWLVRCPTHDDETPSLSVTDRDGRTLVHCFAGCEQSAVIEALRVRRLWPDRTDGKSRRSPSRVKTGPGRHPDRPADHIWPYTDAAGIVVRQTARWDVPDGGKIVRPQRPDGGGGWEWKEMAGPRPLYRLPELIEQSAAPVLIVEGERTADAAAAMLPTYVVTTSSGGAGSAEHTDWVPLRGRHVVVWADADDAGGKYAADVARLARAAGAASVRVVALPVGLSGGWDLADALPVGWTIGIVRELIEASPAADNPDARAQPRTIVGILSAAGLDGLSAATPADELAAAFRELGVLAADLDNIDRGALRVELMRRCSEARLRGIAPTIDAALGGAAAANRSGSTQGRALVLDDPEPWPDPVDGAKLLGTIRATLERYLVLPAHGAAALALWVVHTYAVEAAYVSPILAITSPQKRCGKSRLLELLTGMVRRPLPASSVTPAALFRSVEAFSPTLLVDEAEACLADNEELRGVIDSGHTRATAQVVRVAGDDHEPRVFSTFGPKAIAAIGSLPGTIEDRAVPIRMERRTQAERVERLRRDRLPAELEPLRRQAARWAADNEDALRAGDPDTPESLHDRAADNWRPLLAIADVAGGEWPALARGAAVGLSAPAESTGTEAAVMILADLRDLFVARCADRLTSAEIIAYLVSLADRPWPEWRRGKPLTAPGLARLLRPYGAAPRSVRTGVETAKGYYRGDLEGPWSRYLVPGIEVSGRHTGTSVVPQGRELDSGPAQPVGCDGTENPLQPLGHRGCAGVTARSGGSDWEVVV